MPHQDYSYNAVKDDPDFKALSPEDKISLLNQYDSDFAKLSPEDKYLVVTITTIPQAQGPSAKAQQKPGFFGGLSESLIEPNIELLKTFGRALGGNARAVPQLISSIAGGLATEARKAVTPVEALGRVGAAATGLQTPIENIATGQYGRAAGNVAGLAAPFGLARLFGSVRAAKPARTTIAGVSIPESTGQRLGKPFSTLENVVENTFGGARPFQQFRAFQQQKIAAARDNLLNDIAARTGTPEQVGRDNKLSIDIAKNNEMAELALLNDALEASAGFRNAIQPFTAPLKSVARPLLKRLQQESKLMRPEVDMAILQKIVAAPDRLSFRAFNGARETLRTMLNKYADPVPARQTAILDKLSKSTDRAINDILRAEGRPDLAADYASIAAMRANLERFNVGLLRRIFDAAPEKVPDLLVSSSTSVDDIRKLKATVGPADFNIVSRATVASIIMKATAREATPTIPTPAPVIGSLWERMSQKIGATPNVQKLNGKALREILEELHGTGKLAEIMPSEAIADEFMKLAVEAERLGVSTGSLAAQSINVGTLAGAAGSVMTGNAPLAVATGGTLATFYMLGSIMTKPQGIRSLRQFARAIGTGNQAQITFWGARLGQMLKKETEDDERREIMARIRAHRIGQ